MKPSLLALCCLLLAACNTVAGAGQDLQNAGSAIESEAVEAGTEM